MRQGSRALLMPLILHDEGYPLPPKASAGGSRQWLLLIKTPCRAQGAASHWTCRLLATRSRCSQTLCMVNPMGAEPSCALTAAAAAGETVGAALAGIYFPRKIIMGRKVPVLIGASS